MKKKEIVAINALIKLHEQKEEKKEQDNGEEEENAEKKISAAALKVKRIMKRTRFAE